MTRKKALVLSLIAGVFGISVGILMGSWCEMEKRIKLKELSDKYWDLFLMMNQWMKAIQEKRDIASYLENQGIKKIAVYGMSHAGEALVNELKGTRIQVVYGIDKNAESIYSNIDIVTLDHALKTVDAVIVTAISYFDDIKQTLEEKMKCQILSLEDIVYKM